MPRTAAPPPVTEGPITLYDRRGHATAWPARAPELWTPALAEALGPHIEADADYLRAEAEAREATPPRARPPALPGPHRGRREPTRQLAANRVPVASA